MTPIDKLKELHEKAKPTPWYWRGKLPDAYVYTEDDDFCILGWEDVSDAQLIAHMRNLLPELLELVEAAELIYDMIERYVPPEERYQYGHNELFEALSALRSNDSEKLRGES